MSGLAAAVAAASAKASRCAMAGVFAALDEDDARTLVGLLGDTTVTGAAIARGLLAVGCPVPQQTVTRHRSGECACPASP